MSYRVEIAKGGRAKCKATTCGHASISKDELRLGTWVEMNTKGSHTWRHWGCVTARQISNINKVLRKGDSALDLGLLDGYGELPSEEQKQTVRNALELGYVDDEDWKGPAGGNRPNPPKSPKKTKKADAADGEEDGEAQKPKRGRPKKVKEADAEEDEDEPVKPGSRGKTTGDGDAEAEVAPKKRGRPKKSEAGAPKAAKAKADPTRASGRNRGAVKPSYVDDDAHNDEEGEAEAKNEAEKALKRVRKVEKETEDKDAEEKPKVKRARKAKAEKEAEAVESKSKESEEAAEEKPKAKRARKTKAQKEAEAVTAGGSEGDKMDTDEEVKPAARGKKASINKAARGKKRQSDTDDNLVEEPVKKKRGRPAKKDVAGEAK